MKNYQLSINNLLEETKSLNPAINGSQLDEYSIMIVGNHRGKIDEKFCYDYSTKTMQYDYTKNSVATHTFEQALENIRPKEDILKSYGEIVERIIKRIEWIQSDLKATAEMALDDSKKIPSHHIEVLSFICDETSEMLMGAINHLKKK